MKAFISLVIGLFLAGAIFAAPTNFTLFGDAELTSPGNNSPTAAQIRSGLTGMGYGGVSLAIPAGLTLGDFDHLSAEFNLTAGGCGAGSPRFQVKVIDPSDNTAKNLFVHFGDYPNFTNCPTGSWTSTGDLFAEGKYVETSQLSGGYQLLGYADTVTAYGTYEVTGITLVVDANYAFPATGQTALIDNVKINNTVYTFETANTCKNGGWQNFTSGPGPFANQGLCVSYFARGGQ